MADKELFWISFLICLFVSERYRILALMFFLFVFASQHFTDGSNGHRTSDGYGSRLRGPAKFLNFAAKFLVRKPTCCRAVSLSCTSLQRAALVKNVRCFLFVDCRDHDFSLFSRTLRWLSSLVLYKREWRRTTTKFCQFQKPKKEYQRKQLLLQQTGQRKVFRTSTVHLNRDTRTWKSIEQDTRDACNS